MKPNRTDGQKEKAVAELRIINLPTSALNDHGTNA